MESIGDWVVRRPDGSIDQDYYVRLAHRLRAEQLRKVPAAALTNARFIAGWIQPARFVGRMTRTLRFRAAANLSPGAPVAAGAMSTGGQTTAYAAGPGRKVHSLIKEEKPC